MSIELFVMINDSMTYQFIRHICDNKKKVQITHSFLILKKKKKKTYCPHLIWGISMLGSLRLWPKWPRPRPRAGLRTSLQSLLSFFW